MNPTAFRRALLRWYDSARRDLPWRESQDFHRVWVSEIMLQQTRVEAAIPYYLRFLERFPTIEALANAPENDVLTAWSGLGYYSRARNLQRAATQLVGRGMPGTYEDVLALPGVGPYSAAAISSIALGLPHAAVDGNVLRVISRLANDAEDIGSSAARRRFASRASALLDTARPGDFNQAMMELGATICLPRVPDCAACPVERFCAARAAGTERELPVKRKKEKARVVPLDLVLIEVPIGSGQRIFLVQRSSSERRLADFWELPARTLLPEWMSARGTKVGEFGHRIVNDHFRVGIWRPPAAKAGYAFAKAGHASVPSGKWFDAAELETIPLTTVTKKALAAVRSAAGTSNQQREI